MKLMKWLPSEDVLLLQSVNQSMENIIRKAHQCQGIVSLAHVCDKANSIMTQLGFIPRHLEFDLIEVKNQAQKEMVQQLHPWLKEVLWIRNSDAHYLQDIDHFEEDIDIRMWKALWRDANDG